MSGNVQMPRRFGKTETLLSVLENQQNKSVNYPNGPKILKKYVSDIQELFGKYSSQLTKEKLINIVCNANIDIDICEMGLNISSGIKKSDIKNFLIESTSLLIHNLKEDECIISEEIPVIQISSNNESLRKMLDARIIKRYIIKELSDNFNLYLQTGGFKKRKLEK